MGTSAGSKGPGPKVPFDPPWLDDLAPPEDSGTPQEDGGNDSHDGGKKPDDKDKDDKPSQPLPLMAPPRRFADARSKLTSYTKGKSREGYRETMGHYSKTGMGGASRLASRMKFSADQGARMASFFKEVSNNSESSKDWVAKVKSKSLSQNEIKDLFIQEICPTQGSKEEESCRDSMAEALSEFCDSNPDSDLMALTDDEIKEITKSFMAEEAFNRFYNDIGQRFEQLAPSQSLTLTEEIREYLKEDISTEIDKLWDAKITPADSNLSLLLSKSIERTFKIYEDEI